MNILFYAVLAILGLLKTIFDLLERQFQEIFSIL